MLDVFLRGFPFLWLYQWDGTIPDSFLRGCSYSVCVACLWKHMCIITTSSLRRYSPHPNWHQKCKNVTFTGTAIPKSSWSASYTQLKFTDVTVLKNLTSIFPLIHDTVIYRMGTEHYLFMKLITWIGAYKHMLHYKKCIRKGAAKNKKHLSALGLLYWRFPYLESVMRMFRYFCHHLSREHICTQLAGLVPDWLSSIIILQSKNGIF